MKIVATIEARMDSNRLPGKTLKEVLGRPMLERMIERVRRSKRLDEIVVATTVAENDQQIEALCSRLGVRCFRGSNDDVLLRVVEAARSAKADLIVELTGDCPVIDPTMIDSVIQYYLDHPLDYASNCLERTFPRGTETQVFSLKVLEEVERTTQEPADREHVSLYIYEHPEKYRLGNFAAPAGVGRTDLRLTVDLPQDLELIRAIYSRLYPVKPDFNLQDVIALLDADQALRALNADIAQKPVR